MTEPCPRCGSDDTERAHTPEPGVVGDPPVILCNACGQKTSLDIATGEWDLA
jgi:hypothetical protein